MSPLRCPCFVSLDVNTTPVCNETNKIFTSTHDNFIQTTGHCSIWDGVSHCDKFVLGFYDAFDTSDATDPEVIIKIDVSCRIVYVIHTFLARRE
jgi:hypothetical protein